MFARCADVGEPKLRDVSSSTRSIAREKLRKELEEKCLAMFRNVEVDASGDACCKRIMQLLPQIEAVFEQLRLPFARHDFEAMVSIMDQDGSGGVDKGEFCRGVVQLAEGLQPISIIEIHCGVSFVKGQVSLSLQKTITNQAGIDEANRALTDLAQSIDLMNHDCAEAQDSMMLTLRELERSVSEVRLAQHRAQAELSLFRKDFREAFAGGWTRLPRLAEQGAQNGVGTSSGADPDATCGTVSAPTLDAVAGPAEAEAANPQAELQAEGGTVTSDEATPPCDVTALPLATPHQPLCAGSDISSIHSQELAERLRAKLTSINSQLGESIEACEALLRGSSGDGSKKTAKEMILGTPSRPRSPLPFGHSPGRAARRLATSPSEALMRRSLPPRDMEPLSLGPSAPRGCVGSSNTAGEPGRGSGKHTDGSASSPAASFSLIRNLHQDSVSPGLQDGFLAALIAGGSDQSLAQLAAGDTTALSQLAPGDGASQSARNLSSDV